MTREEVLEALARGAKGANELLRDLNRIARRAPRNLRMGLRERIEHARQMEEARRPRLG